MKFDVKAQSAELLKNLRYLQSLSVEEYTFRKKWEELNDWIPANRDSVELAKHGIWEPSDFQDKARTLNTLERLEPAIVFADDDRLKQLWEIYRKFVSTAEYNQAPYRGIRFFIVDVQNRKTRRMADMLMEWQVTKKGCAPLPWPVLGLASVNSDFFTLDARDQHIGWTHEDRKKGNLKHTAVGSTIVPTQPFGYNFLGGKLIASLITTKAIRTEYQLRYRDVLVGMTTTSLYGGHSMYDGIPRWKNVGLSKGAMAIEPTADIYKKWTSHLKVSKEEEYEATNETTGAKSKKLALMFKEAGINPSDFNHGFERGVYFSEFYENTNEFLRGRCKDDDLKLKPEFSDFSEEVEGTKVRCDDDIEAIMRWWRPKAIERYQMLLKKSRLKTGKTFYDALSRLDYDTAWQQHKELVGR